MAGKDTNENDFRVQSGQPSQVTVISIWSSFVLTLCNGTSLQPKPPSLPLYRMRLASHLLLKPQYNIRLFV